MRSWSLCVPAVFGSCPVPEPWGYVPPFIGLVGCYPEVVYAYYVSYYCTGGYHTKQRCPNAWLWEKEFSSNTNSVVASPDHFFFALQLLRRLAVKLDLLRIGLTRL